jgi:hypothetical protein
MGLYPKGAELYKAVVGIPRGPHSHLFIVDPQTGHGDDDNNGQTFERPLATLEAAEDLCVTNHNDAVLVVGGPTACNLAAELNWDKSYTHLIGLTGDLPGVGQRARIYGLPSVDLDYLIDFQGSGCIVKNIQAFNENDVAETSGAAIVSGMRNYFKNFFAAGMGHLTAAAQAGAYSLHVTGPENFFDRCAIGVSTIERTAHNAELILSGTNCKRNHFRKTQFLSQSVDAGKVLIRIAADTQLWQLIFEECIWSNLAMNSGAGAGGTKIDHAIEDGATMYHQIQLVGLNTAFGCTAFTDVATYVFTHGAAVGGAVAPIALNNLTT